NKVYTMAIASFVMALSTLALGIVPVFWIYLAIMAVFGVTMPVFNTPTTVLLQEKVDPNYLGRIFGVFSMISTSMMPIGMLIFGPLSDVIAIEWLLVGTGFFSIILAISLVRSKRLIEAGKPVMKEAVPE